MTMNLIRLIKKDLDSNKKGLLINTVFPVFYLFILNWKFKGQISMTISTIIVFLYTFVVFVRDEKFRAFNLYCSLPFTRKNIVLARYLFSWLLIIAYFLLFVAVSYATRYGTAYFGGENESVLTLRGFFTAFIIATLAVWLVLPPVFRFGVTKGFMVGAVGVPVLLTASLHFLTMNTTTKRFIVIVIKFIAGAVKAMARANTAFIENNGFGLYFLFAILLLMITGYISLKCSETLFARRDF